MDECGWMWGDKDNDYDVDMLSVCSPVHTVWCDSVVLPSIVLNPKWYGGKVESTLPEGFPPLCQNVWH